MSREEVKISDVISSFMEDMGIREKIMDQLIIETWEEQMGTFMKNRTDTIFMKNRVLHVRVNSPAIKNELSYGKSKIVRNINQHIKEDYLLDVKFI